LIASSYLLFPSVSIERVWSELCKLSNFSLGIIELQRFKLLQHIFPQLKHITTDNITKLVHPVSRYPPETPTIIKVMSLFPGDDLVNICMYLKVTRKDIAWCRRLMNLRSLITKPQTTLVEWVYLYADPHTDLLLKVVSEHQDNKGRFLEEHRARFDTLHSHVERVIRKTSLISS